MNSSRNLLLIAILLGVVSSVCPVKPSALLKRSLLRHRLLAVPSALRLKRQLFREDIPHHRPLTGNTYYLHAGFPHPSRWYEGSQSIAPNPNPVTHHHFDKKPSLHDDSNNDNRINIHDHNNNQVNNEHQHQTQLVHPVPPSQQLTLDQHQQLHQHQKHYQQNPHNPHNHHNSEPYSVSVVNNKSPHSVNIHSAIVHSGGVGTSGIVDNALGNISPPAPVGPLSQANFDPVLSPFHEQPVNPIATHVRHIPGKPIDLPTPTPEPYTFDDYSEGGGGDYNGPNNDENHHGSPEVHHHGAPEPHHHGAPEPHHHQPPPHLTSAEVHTKTVERKPKTIIHYHPVTVGNIINFNDDNKPEIVTPNPLNYGPPRHVPGVPLSDKDPMLSIAEPFMQSPFKTVPGLPEFLNYGKDEHLQYGPPQHVPGPPLGSIDLSPMLPSFGPPIKPETEYGAALPVIAHLHTESPQHHHHHHHHHRPRPRRVKHPRKGRIPHQHHVHLHHIHHPPAEPPHIHSHPGGLDGPFYNSKPSYVVQGHVPSSKFFPFHSPFFRSHSHTSHSHHHHQKSIWSW